MTHFRFRYKRVGYMRWRRRTLRARAESRHWPLSADARYAPSMAAWRRTQPPVALLAPIGLMLQVGSYLVGEEGDPQLTGHPDIRY
ncbi:hypothetical protein KB206_15650 [Microvirga sp. STS02]|uniref:hypothetical protein n=1 Tax=Hymenobacter negativus TaxID=2795026 RepID=UPI0018DC6727|nr:MULTISPECIES: hypothetical protein [Bacteria]MBH8570326.1 hypothetical protein [Hymenobacter negativus]MBR7210065.1 hypothetical protein [Microvirga sp. STS02]